MMLSKRVRALVPTRRQVRRRTISTTQALQLISPNLFTPRIRAITSPPLPCHLLALDQELLHYILTFLPVYALKHDSDSDEDDDEDHKAPTPYTVNDRPSSCMIHRIINVCNNSYKTYPVRHRPSGQLHTLAYESQHAYKLVVASRIDDAIHENLKYIHRRLGSYLLNARSSGYIEGPFYLLPSIGVIFIMLHDMTNREDDLDLYTSWLKHTIARLNFHAQGLSSLYMIKLDVSECPKSYNNNKLSDTRQQLKILFNTFNIFQSSLRIIRLWLNPSCAHYSCTRMERHMDRIPSCVCYLHVSYEVSNRYFKEPRPRDPQLERDVIDYKHTKRQNLSITALTITSPSFETHMHTYSRDADDQEIVLRSLLVRERLDVSYLILLSQLPNLSTLCVSHTAGLKLYDLHQHYPPSVIPQCLLYSLKHLTLNIGIRLHEVSWLPLLERLRCGAVMGSVESRKPLHFPHLTSLELLAIATSDDCALQWREYLGEQLGERCNKETLIAHVILHGHPSVSYRLDDDFCYASKCDTISSVTYVEYFHSHATQLNDAGDVEEIRSFNIDYVFHDFDWTKMHHRPVKLSINDMDSDSEHDLDDASKAFTPPCILLHTFAQQAIGVAVPTDVTRFENHFDGCILSINKSDLKPHEHRRLPGDSDSDSDGEDSDATIEYAETHTTVFDEDGNVTIVSNDDEEESLAPLVMIDRDGDVIVVSDEDQPEELDYINMEDDA